MPTKNVAIEQDRSPDWYPCLTELIYTKGNNTAIYFNGEKRSTGLKVLLKLTLKFGPSTSPARDIKLYLNNTSANTLTLIETK